MSAALRLFTKKGKKMKTRVITGIGIFVVAAALLALNFTPVFCIGIAALSVMACFELLRVFGMHKDWHISAPTYAIAGAFPLLAYITKSRPDLRVTFILVFASVLFSFLVYLLGVSVFSHKKIKYAKVAEVFMSVSYVIISFTSLSLLMYVNKGIYYFGILIISSWGCDAAAYFVGSKLGKHKLIPDVSPNKSVEGAIGGILASMILNVLYGLLIDKIGVFDASANYVALAVLGLVLSVVAMVGDLIASLIKRENGIKDYSNIFPGHGGIMDRFDSVFPIATFLLMMSGLFAPFV